MKRKLILIAVLILLGLTGSAVAETTNALDLANAGYGARPMALGQAYIAVADDVNAIFTNPAGLGTQKSWGLTSMSTKLLDRVEYKLIGVAVPTNLGTIGLGYLSAATPAGYLTTDKTSLAAATPISYGSSLVMLSYGRDLNEVIKVSESLGKLSIGANYKMFNNKFDGTSGNGTGSSLDLGFLLKANDQLSAGLNFRNLGGSMTWDNGTKENLQLVTTLGGAYNYSRGLVALDMEFCQNQVLLHGGAEFQPLPLLVLRAGANQVSLAQNETVVGLTAGLGLKIEGISIDYAYRQDPTQANNSAHYFSFSLQPTGQRDSLVKNNEPKEKVAAPASSQPDGVYTVKADVSKAILKYYQ